MNPTPGRDAEGHASKKQREHAPHRGERDAGEHEHGLPHRVEGREKEEEDQEEGKRHDESVLGRPEFVLGLEPFLEELLPPPIVPLGERPLRKRRDKLVLFEPGHFLCPFCPSMS